MRRKDKEILDKELIGKILAEAEIVRIAMCDGTEPYLLPMHYAYLDGCIYIHSAKEGRKIDVLTKNNRVAFQTDTGIELVVNEDACMCGPKYLSVFGTGNTYFVDDKEVKTRALDAIMIKYTGRVGFKYPEKAFEQTLIIKIEIDFLSGKKSGY